MTNKDFRSTTIRGKQPEAVKRLNGLVEKSGSAEANSQWGSVLREMKHPLEAAAYFRRAAQLDPDNAEYPLSAGRAYAPRRNTLGAGG